MSLFEELKRRNVFRVGIAYGVAAWLLLQVTDIVTPILQLPDSIPPVVLFLLVIGFIPAVILAWAFELTPEGVKLESEVDRSKSITGNTGQKLDRTIIVVLAIAITFLLIDKFLLQDDPTSVSPATTSVIPANAGIQAPATATSGNPATTSGNPATTSVNPATTSVNPATTSVNPATTSVIPANAGIQSAPSQNSVAVLPFVTMSNGPDDEYFSDGLTEEIINALAQLPELLVTARTSAFHFKGQNIPIAQISSQLGVDNIVEGSVRRAGEQLRITAQLVRASDGFHLWSETYDRRTEDTLAVQADIAEKVASALNIVLDFKQRARMKRVGVRNVEAYTAYQKGRELFEDSHVEGDLFSMLRKANQYFEQATALAPDFFTAYINHSDLYVHFLMTNANGQLDGNISDEDIRQAPKLLQQDFENSLKYAKNRDSVLWVEFDMALTMGDWRGLSSRAINTLQAPGCTPALWSQLASAAFGQAGLMLESFNRVATCDPVSLRPWAHIAFANLWLDQPQSTINMAKSNVLLQEHQMVALANAIALTALDRLSDAEAAINRHLRAEDTQLFAKALIAAQSGDASTSSQLLDEYLGKYGPDDYHALMIEAARGRRNEANRLASLIDSRPFGYMTLMQSIYNCVCGAPFDLEATPVFASMLSESGLPWPPAKPIEFPLKDW